MMTVFWEVTLSQNTVIFLVFSVRTRNITKNYSRASKYGKVLEVCSEMLFHYDFMNISHSYKIISNESGPKVQNSYTFWR